MSLTASPYLTGLLDRFGQPNNDTALQAIGALQDSDQLSALKAQFNLGWSHLALSEPSDFARLGELQSQFADRAIEVALKSAWTSEKLSGDPKGFFILGLGKLGGHDLNFSSDIDLIAYYDPDIFPVPVSRGQAYIAGKISKHLTRTLIPPHDPNFVYRVDWRLRPEASVTGLAMSTNRAQDFYFFRALPWHRLALLKARYVAGDGEAARSFLKTLSPFIWRQNLDFRAIDELADLKTRINLEHPRLKLERRDIKPIMHQPLGFNVKLGTGGIREIEFIANAQQLIWGGKHYPLRTTNTLQAIAHLKDCEFLSAQDEQDLSNAYRHHRRLENALQMMRNGHEHVLPEKPESWAPIAQLLGQCPDTLMLQTTAHRRTVSTRFKAMFQTSDTPPPPLISLDLPELDPRSLSIIQDWRSGFRRYNIRESRRPKLKPLGHALTRSIIASGQGSQGIERIDRYLGSLLRSEQYLSLLAANPALLDALINPLLYSPHMSVLLKQSPHIIDTFLDPTPTPIEFVMAETDYETRLERLRRFVNEGLFQTYHTFLNGQIGWPDMATALTKQAETTLEAALTIAKDDLNAPDLSISVIGMGKLGQARMAPQSDLDLIFLFDDAVDRDLASKAVRRLTTILTTPLREGIAYELDMRLRPSGRSGPPAVTLSAFEAYHLKTARNWEHIALVPARIVAGDASLGQKAEAIITATLTRPRDPDQLIGNAHYMWNKIAAERISDVPPDQWNTKLRRGGMMMADFWDAVGSLAQGPRLDWACHDWTEFLYWERLLGLTGHATADIPAPYQSFLPQDLPAKQSALEQQVNGAVASYGISQPSHVMRPVKWV